MDTLQGVAARSATAINLPFPSAMSDHPALDALSRFSDEIEVPSVNSSQFLFSDINGQASLGHSVSQNGSVVGSSVSAFTMAPSRKRSTTRADEISVGFSKRSKVLADVARRQIHATSTGASSLTRTASVPDINYAAHLQQVYQAALMNNLLLLNPGLLNLVQQSATQQHPLTALILSNQLASVVGWASSFGDFVTSQLGGSSTFGSIVGNAYKASLESVMGTTAKNATSDRQNSNGSDQSAAALGIPGSFGSPTVSAAQTQNTVALSTLLAALGVEFFGTNHNGLSGNGSESEHGIRESDESSTNSECVNMQSAKWRSDIYSSAKHLASPTIKIQQISVDRQDLENRFAKILEQELTDCSKRNKDIMLREVQSNGSGCFSPPSGSGEVSADASSSSSL
ncbi:hypothetical protein AB6A40_007721 [Gnathostoma spinigerum]|uniref:Uncharacterized protein n=1 Tax=Gnathostoma spinigerum TaxID=75299 RepID=A0ABD6EP97_9BILA